MLGEIRQSVHEIREMMQNANANAQKLDDRVKSLEATRTRAKAWGAGASAAFAAVAWVVSHIYSLVKSHG